MKNATFLFLFLAFGLSLNAQNVGGTATYKTAGKLNFKMDSEQMSPEQKKMIEERIKKSMQKEFTLKFNRNESLYEEVVELEKQGGRRMGFMTMMAGGTANYYKNLQEKRYTEATEIFGKPFLIQDSLEVLEWEISKETKSIGNYICQKATAMRIRELTKISANRGEGIKDSSIIDTSIVTAWFTMQIPVSHGPGQYFGLPGLILEINDGDNTILCTKVSLNTQTSVEIKEPESGEEVSSEEFQEILDEKMQQMQENFGNGQGGRGRGRGSFEITIGR